MRTLLSALLATAALAAPAFAQGAGDVVTLKNGDRLTGTVKSITKDEVVLATAAAGDVKIKIGDVQNLTTAGGVPMTNANGERFIETISGVSNGQLVVGTPGATRNVAIDSLVEHRAAVEWSGSFNLGGSITTGNTERRSANAAAEAIRRTDDTRLTLRGTWDYGEERKDTDADGRLDSWDLSQRRTFGSAQFDYFFSKTMYGLLNASGENDLFADLELRLTYGAGLGVQIFDTSTFALAGEAGVSWVDENRYVGEDKDYPAARIAYSLRWDITADTQLLQDAQIFPSLEEKDDVYARVDTRIRTSLTDSMFAQLQHVWDWDNTPGQRADGSLKDRSDHRVIAAVGWSF